MSGDGVPRVSGSLLVRDRKRGPQWYAKYRIDGVQHKKLIGPVWRERGRPPAGVFTRKMAEATLHAILTDARRGATSDPVRGTQHTFGAACDEWLRYVEHDRQRAPTTVGDYRRTVKNHYLPEFGAATPVDAITTERVERFRSRLLTENRMTRASIRKTMTLLSGVFKRAKRKKWIAANPCDDVESVEVKVSGDFQVLSAEEVHAVIRAAGSEQDAAVFTVAAFAGLRMGELRALRWRDVDFAGQTIHVRRNYTHVRERAPKSGKVRSVPLIDQAARALDQLSRRDDFTQGGDLVFCNDFGDYLHDGEVRRRFYAALAAAGLGHKRKCESPMTFHDLRHTFGTLAVKVWDLPKVQGYMGHANISTTMGYVHHVPKASDADALTRLVGQTDLSGQSVQVVVEPGASKLEK